MNDVEQAQKAFRANDDRVHAMLWQQLPYATTWVTRAQILGEAAAVSDVMAEQASVFVRSAETVEAETARADMFRLVAAAEWAAARDKDVPTITALQDDPQIARVVERLASRGLAPEERGLVLLDLRAAVQPLAGESAGEAVATLAQAYLYGSGMSLRESYRMVWPAPEADRWERTGLALMQVAAVLVAVSAAARIGWLPISMWPAFAVSAACTVLAVAMIAIGARRR